MSINKVFSKRASNALYDTCSEVQKKKIFYVYVYTNKHTGTPFYIGKGKNYRATDHINDAKKSSESTPKLEMIRSLFTGGMK